MIDFRAEDYRGAFSTNGTIPVTGGTTGISAVVGSQVLNTFTAYLNVTNAGSDSIVAKLQHSYDNSNWADMPLVSEASVMLNSSNTAKSITGFSDAPYKRLYNTVA